MGHGMGEGEEKGKVLETVRNLDFWFLLSN